MRTLKLVALAVSISAAAAAQAADSYTLKVAHFLPSTSNAQVNIIEPWCEQLRQESNDRIKCQLYPSMQLGGTPAKLADMARNGVADIVWTAPAYSAGKFPRVEALELPFMLPYGGKAGNELIWSFYEQYAKDDFKGYKMLSLFGDGGMDLHVRGKQVKTLADLSGLKLRASSRTAAKTLEALGATPVSMPPAQMTEAISKGVVDGALASWEVVPATKLNEVTQYHSVAPEGQHAIGYTVLTMLMNQKKFDSMPKDLQEIIDRNSGKALSERFATAWDKAMDDARKATPAEGMVAIDAANYKAMQDAAAGVADAWAKEISEKGIDGKALVEGARTLSSATR
ncbi:TRAP-type C4-dicarboxylate transport system, substrate-binding protein [Geopseudomonas sagittaria]|uniref:TRAP-type C4-dicarboxylate transport system, substrate-binding protein n=1 Tax=Geopseudomonas sagittaria TaxID=1135990 RepID=A0A1I5SMD9_9GAMM|nr:TRAP transporter substrate-binding protein [Pseudomonas sagittaria]MCM2332147.1 TRAP transporter substrate-binding protein [Pseudomonas sagittaria]SFP71923.1 TRAP-type C4-dicarboxylate transport system, substrate-binding protein [Pseudomonas sagittaria]